MNKKANRRAFFVCLFIGLMYASVVFRLPEKMNIARISGEKKIMPSSVVGSVQKTNHDISLPEVPASIFKNQPAESESPKVAPHQPEPQLPPAAQRIVKFDDKTIEPNFFISLPLVVYAIKEGLIEREGLIFVHKEGYNTVNCKKPIDILRDKDEQGLKAIARLIGKRQSLDFLKKEGIVLNQDMEIEKIIAGVGYSVEKEKLLSIYNKHVSEDFKDLFPYVIQGTAVVKTKQGFEFSKAREGQGADHAKMEDQEWTMPNLINLSVRAAVEKLALHTSKIKVYGNGNVVEQNPRAFERTRGETECAIYGRTAR
ncbi:MAG: hypothetical protein H6Q53_91 [Deltaproteobacteria bacterium]|nr:hypothetical protein [Deltaproteobacteria bacterium]